MRKKKSLQTLFCIIMMLCLLSSCVGANNTSSNGTQSNEETNPYEELQGKRIGVLAASHIEDTIKDLIPSANIEYGNSYNDLAYALEAGTIDAYVADQPIARKMVEKYKKQQILTYMNEEGYGYIYPKNSQKSDLIRTQMNSFLEKIKADNTLQTIDSIWFGNDESLKVIDKTGITGTNGELTMAVASAIGEPFCYIKDEQYVGYDIDIAMRFCKEYGYSLKIVDIDPGNMINLVAKGQCDFGGACITINEVRTEVINFSDDNYSAGSVIVIRQTAEYDMNKLSTDKELEAYRGYKIGVVSGSIWDQVAQDKIPDGQIRYYNSNTDLVIALDTGKIDGYVTDEPTVRILRKNYSSHVVGAVLNQYSYAYIFQKDNEESKIVCDQLDEFLAKIKDDGTLENLDDIWFGTDTTLQTVDYTGLSAENGTLKFSVFSGAGAPFVYIQNGEFVGYDIDIAVRFCKEYGYGIEIIDTDFAGILARVATGQSDFGGSSICVTEERKESVLFSEANYVGGGVLVIKADSSVEASAIGLWQSLINSFNKTFIRENRWKMFANGLGITVLITLISAACGTIIGFASFMIYRKKYKIFKGIVNIFSGILHKTPVVVILMILYYLVFGDFAIGGIGVSCIGFSIIFACSVNSLLKVAVDAVDPGQMEAAKALGFSDGYGFIRVVLPQALRLFLPGYKGEIVSLIKETAIVGYIAVQDLTKVGDIIRSRTYDAFFPLIASAVMYFVVAGILEMIIDRIQFSIDPKHRRYERVLRGVKTK